MTFASTGRSMKNFEIIGRAVRRGSSVSSAAARSSGREPPSCMPETTTRSSASMPFVMTRRLADQLADLDRALLDDVVLAGDQHVASALVGCRWRGPAPGACPAGRRAARARARNSRAAAALVHCADTARAGSVPVEGSRSGADVVERALVRIAVLGLQADLDRHLLQVLDRHAALGHDVGADAQHVLSR